jgi:hypothetical protein
MIESTQKIPNIPKNARIEYLFFRTASTDGSNNWWRSKVFLPKFGQTIAIATPVQAIQADALTPDLPLLPILKRSDAPSNIYEGRGAANEPIIWGRLPGELLAGVSEPLFGVPVDLHPSDQRGMVERFRPQRRRDRTFADNGPQ